jgi:small-conductance mechanosensitive channel
LITQRVENSSLADPRVLLTTQVQVAYGTDVRALQPLLARAVAVVDRVVADPEPVAVLLAFAADGMDIAVQFWILDPENGQANVRSDANLAILSVLNERGIEIPYPQRVVHASPHAATTTAPTAIPSPAP